MLRSVHWKSFHESIVKVTMIHGVPAVFGNANFIAQKYRICNFTGPFVSVSTHHDELTMITANNQFSTSSNSNVQTLQVNEKYAPWQPCPKSEDYLAYGPYRMNPKHFQN